MERDHSEDLGIDESIIINYILEKNLGYRLDSAGSE
jgi:hypothetical protein